jgi:hypothetical protein
VTTISILTTPSSGGILLVPTAQQSKVKLGDTISFGLGAAVALTGQVTMNFSFSDAISFNIRSNGQKFGGTSSNVGQFSAGFTLGLSPHLSLDFLGSIGITPEAPSFGLGLTLTRSFSSIRDLFPFGKSQ